MVKQLHSKQSLQHLHSRIFELFTEDSTSTFSKFIDLLSFEIRDFLQGEQCGVYLLDDSDGTYRLSPRRKDRTNEWRHTFDVHDIAYRESTIFYREAIVNPIEVPVSSNYQFSYIPLVEDEKLYGFFIILHFSTEEMDQDLLQTVRREVSKPINKIRSVFSALEEKEKYELLYKGTSDFHASNHSQDVLRAVVQTVRRIHPQFNYYLLLSQDYTSHSGLPIKNLSYDRDVSSQASAQAYLSGELQIEDRHSEDQSILYAPLRGKQGVYGVLQVVSPKYLYFQEAYIDFFDLLTQDAGNALENAQLYQQSRRLIDDLQLINSTSKQLNSTMRLSEKIAYMADCIDHSLGADEVGFIMFKDERHDSFDILEGSSAFFETTDCHSFVSSVDQLFIKNEEAVFIGDLSKRWDRECPYGSLMAVPMTDHEYLDGLAIVVHHEPYYFSFESFKLLQSLVHHSTLSFANSMLHEELEKTITMDYLTKLHSRNFLDKKVEEHLRADECGHFLLFDIDNFKRINDTYGHQIGDEVICQVAECIQGLIAPYGLGARWGGEELAVYLRNTTDKDAYKMADLIRSHVLESTNPSVTVSCGIASWNASVRLDVKQIVKDADQALYMAKEMGKNKIIVSS